MKTVVLTEHAKAVVDERGLQWAWVPTTARQSNWTEPDPDPTLERRFASIPERGGRFLRVVCEETDDTIRVVTAFFDRRARRPT